MSLLATFAMLTLCVGVGLLSVVFHTNADASESASVGTSATVPSVSSGTTTPITNYPGNGSPPLIPPFPYFPPVVSTSTPSGSLLVPATLTVKVDPNDAVAKPIPKQQGKIVYNFLKTDQPKFSGETNIYNGIIYLEISGPFSFQSVVQASDTGDWSWVSPEHLIPGTYQIFAIVQDPFHPERTAAVTESFSIGRSQQLPPNTSEPVKPGKPRAPNVAISVLGQNKVVYPGQQVTTVVRLATYDKKPITATLDYQVLRGTEEVGYSSDTVTVTGSDEYMKILYVNPLAQEGGYTVVVRVRLYGYLATSYDTFTVQGRGIVMLAGRVLLDATTLFQILLVLFLLFSIIGYFEYNKVTVLSHTIRQVTEDDLKNES